MTMLQIGTGLATGGGPPGRRFAIPVIVGLVVAVGLGLLILPIVILTEMFSSTSSVCLSQPTAAVTQPAASGSARGMPSNYLFWYKRVGQQYGVPWTILAGIGTVESNNGQSTLPGVHSGQNGFGAAGPMQIGIEGASGNSWGGAPIHPASQVISGGVATDEDGDGIANVYDPADAIAGAAKYLVRAGVQTNPSGAIFAYNHLQSYVQSVETYASQYASGGFSVVSAIMPTGSQAGVCSGAGSLLAVQAPTKAVATAIAFAEQQLGKPYLWGGTGPDAFDCSGLVMMAYRSAGINIERTAANQYASETRVPASQVQPGDLVFFAGADGTVTNPGHVGLVIGGGKMIEAYATGFPIRVASYIGRNPVGFTAPWAKAGSGGGTTPGSPPVPTGGIPIPGIAIGGSGPADGGAP